MPSGAKKRKAAKKKKEQEANISSSTTNPHGYDDSKSQDEKGSDGGEVGSPAHQDYHNNHHPFNEGNEELEEGDPSSVRSVVAEDKSVEKFSSLVEGSQKVGFHVDGGVEIERNLKSVEIFKFRKESRDMDDRSSSSSSSSSDDESRAIEKKQDKESNDSISDAVSYTNVVKPVESSPAEETQITENASVGNTNPVAEISAVIEAVVPASEETLSVIENAPIENSLVSDVITSGLKLSTQFPETVTSFSPLKNEDKIYPLSNESAKPSPSESESVSNAHEGEELPPSSAHVDQSSNVTQRNKDSEIPESSENQPLVAPAPRVVQKSSWLSCCGIFDVITGSSR
ncbi:hypothetical protein PanWU01x14_349800 [Parasponia andersonii]|uniref:Uncharacterized protein n=1 Tax=Parasponia andersonii TaxID=3476 RepID=A0A2P5AB85_PARAD|nr:hypothetical protein PanWU01x14_349800 [Parasponia andersonii]